MASHSALWVAAEKNKDWSGLPLSTSTSWAISWLSTTSSGVTDAEITRPT